MIDTYAGSCFCGGVRFEVTGAPVAEGFCHCADCRAWTGAPITAYAFWPGDAVKITAGQDLIGGFAKGDKNDRRHCTRCGGTVMSEARHFGLTDVYPALMPDFPFRPRLHVYYAERMIPVTDDLPKYLDLPAEIGGSGELFDG